jgi:hypothetical protein
MTMTSSVVGLATGSTEVRVTADIDIVGRIAQFGRGMIESVNKQMFKQFTVCVRATLASSATSAALADQSIATSATPSAPTPNRAEPAGPPGAPPPAWASVLATPTSGSIVPASPIASAPPGASTTTSSQPVRLLPVLFRALADYLGGVLSRLFGRKQR